MTFENSRKKEGAGADAPAIHMKKIVCIESEVICSLNFVFSIAMNCDRRMPGL